MQQQVEPWLQLAVMVFTLFGFFLWSRSEASADRRKAEADWRRSEEETKALRREGIEKMAEVRRESDANRADIDKKHAVLEERYINWLVKQERK